jgi:TetR/AcrR family transcriptional repressor of nem operon
MAASTPRTEKGRATRQRIIQAAAELVGERGAAATSLDEVGARSGASRSQLYHYFDDRDDLIRAVIDATTDAVLGAQDEFLDSLDTWAGIERWFRALVDLQVDRQARGGCPLGTLAGQLAERDPRFRTAIAEGLGRWEQHLREGLDRMQRRGKLRPQADPGRLATATMASVQGGLLLTQVRRDPQQLRIALDGARTLLRDAAA